MAQDPSGEYLRNAVMTAGPEQLQMMLYDGAIRFARQGREALERKDTETSCEKLIRAQRIVLELQNGLRHEVNPALCEQMAGLYSFIYNRLIDANLNGKITAADEALRVLEHQRETWRLLINRLVEISNENQPHQEAAAPGAAESFSAEG